ncbi:DUF6625 family protein [Sphingomonas sp.]|uniref:DUF6625 family protein n=1 Tax=Sphingomonas sp. TaxID=28214 RepID=UPI003CC64AD7
MTADSPATGAPAQASLVILLTWFGPWPAWMRFFLASCRYNPTVHWAIIGDAEPPADVPPNVSFVTHSFAGYRALVAARLGIECAWPSAYKLCDLKPVLGYLHPELIAGYDFWGFGDIDVIYGDIRAIYDATVFEHDIISSHPLITAGHLTLIRNSPRLNASFKRVRGWRGLLSRPDHRGFDEFQWSHLFSELRGDTWFARVRQRLRSPSLPAKGYFVEQHSSALWPLPWIDGSTNYPEFWYWRRGRLTATGAGDREFLYLHFTNWQSSRWVDGDVAVWKRLDSIDHLAAGRPDAFRIGADGFTALD